MARQTHAYHCWREYRIGPGPRLSFFSLGKEFTARRLGGQLQKLRRRRKRIQSNDTPHISRALADKAPTLASEVLHIQHITKTAHGNNPGTHVKVKAGLNRSILASNWGQLAMRLRYKCGRFETVDPRYTSQTCHHCG